MKSIKSVEKIYKILKKTEFFFKRAARGAFEKISAISAAKGLPRGWTKGRDGEGFSSFSFGAGSRGKNGYLTAAGKSI